MQDYFLMQDLCVFPKSEQHDSLNSASAQSQTAQWIIFCLPCDSQIVILFFQLYTVNGQSFGCGWTLIRIFDRLSELPETTSGQPTPKRYVTLNIDKY